MTAGGLALICSYLGFTFPEFKQHNVVDEYFARYTKNNKEIKAYFKVRSDELLRIKLYDDKNFAGSMELSTALYEDIEIKEFILYFAGKTPLKFETILDNFFY